MKARTLLLPLLPIALVAWAWAEYPDPYGCSQLDTAADIAECVIYMDAGDCDDPNQWQRMTGPANLDVDDEQYTVVAHNPDGCISLACSNSENCRYVTGDRDGNGTNDLADFALLQVIVGDSQ